MRRHYGISSLNRVWSKATTRRFHCPYSLACHMLALSSLHQISRSAFVEHLVVFRDETAGKTTELLQVSPSTRRRRLGNIPNHEVCLFVVNGFNRRLRLTASYKSASAESLPSKNFLVFSWCPKLSDRHHGLPVSAVFSERDRKHVR